MDPKIENKTNHRMDSFDIISLIFLVFYSLIIFYPFYNAILTSIVTAKQYMLHPAMIIPRNVTFENYKIIFSNSLLVSGFKNTLIVVGFGLIYSLGTTTCMAYAFSRKNFPGKRLFFALVLFTMFFSGGLIPLYLLVKNLNLIGRLSSLVLVHGVVPFYMIVMKSSFEQIPASLEESAKIDGANDITIFVRIMLPLQLALLATFTLFTAVDFWNEWYYPMLFIKESNKLTIQAVLRTIIYRDSTLMSKTYSSMNQEVFPTGLKIAAVVVTMAPVMIFYPFLQKYFAKGVLVGAIKM